MKRHQKKLTNIFLIILDSARQDCFGCYGNNESLTPNIDKLAEDSIVCNNFYSGGAGTAQSHGAMFLGQHSTRTGLVHNLSEIKEDIYPFTKLLSNIGYSNYGHSKIVVPPAGSEKLFYFDEMIYPIKGNKKNGVSQQKRIIDYLRGFPRLWNFIKGIYKRTFGIETLLSSAARHVDGKESLDYLYNTLEDKKHSLFLFTTIMHPHTPYFPPEWAFNRVFKDKKIDKRAYEIQTDFHKWINGNYGDLDRGISDMKSLYKAELLYGDSLVGQFINKLKESNQYKDSIIILTSDHGEFFGEHGALNHGSTIYDELFKLPCIIKTPENRHFGIDQLTTHVDLFPTLLDLLAIDLDDYSELVLDGYSILDLPKNRFLVIDSPPIVLPGRLSHYPKVIEKYSLFYRGVVDNNYKYIWRSDGNQYLYKRDQYEDEANNIFSSNVEISKDMHNKMLQYYESIKPDFQISKYPINIGPTAASLMTSTRIRKELKKLGYF